MIVILAWKTALAPAPSSIPRLDASSLCTHANTAQSHTRHIHTHTHALSTYLPMFLAGHLAQVHFLFAVARGGGHRNRGRRAVSYCRCGWRGRGCVSTMLACSQRTHTHTHTHYVYRPCQRPRLFTYHQEGWTCPRREKEKRSSSRAGLSCYLRAACPLPGPQWQPAPHHHHCSAWCCCS